MSDKFDQLIIKALQQDARQPVSAIAEQVNLSRSAVSERLKRLEQSGEILGYQVVLGNKTTVFGQLQEVERQIQAIPEFTECDKVTGDDCFIARLHVRSMEQLDTLLDRLNSYAETNTAIVKKTPVKRRLPPMA